MFILSHPFSDPIGKICDWMRCSRYKMGHVFKSNAFQLNISDKKKTYHCACKFQTGRFIAVLVAENHNPV